MAKTIDKISSLIDPRYFNWIRESILRHGKINVRALARELGILDGNTYFRNFIEDNKQDYLGVSGLNSILERCGFEVKVVAVRKHDIPGNALIRKMNDEAFGDIRNTISNIAGTVKKAPKVVKVKKDTTIKNANVINNGIMGISELSAEDEELLKLLSSEDEDEILVGIDSTFSPSLRINPDEYE